MRKLLFDCVMVMALAILLFFAVSAIGDTSYHTSIYFNGEIKTVFSVPATVNGKVVEVNIVNGFVPDQILEGQSDGKVTLHNFIFRTNILYNKNKKYEYVHESKGFTITENRQRSDGKSGRNTSESIIYMLKKK